MGINGVDLKVSTIREARYVEARIRLFRKKSDWTLSRLPKGEEPAIDACNRMILELALSPGQNGKEFLNSLEGQMREDLLPESQFDWIKEAGDQAILFVSDSLCRSLPLQLYYNGQGIGFIFFLMDLSRVFHPVLTLKGKEDLLGSLYEAWQKLEKQGWLLSMSEAHLRWAAQYLLERPIILSGIGGPSPDPNNSDIQVVKDYVLRSFYFPSISGAELREFTRSMKGALASKKNREKGKTLNCQISEQRSKQLAELAEYHDCSKAKMIERLIKWKYQKLKSERLI